MTSTEEKIDLKKIINAILKEINTIEAIYLFGSIAKGEENERSDYDIAVIVRDDLEYSSPFLYEIYHASRLLYGTDILIRCKSVVEKIEPIIAEGNKVGYHV